MNKNFTFAMILVGLMNISSIAQSQQLDAQEQEIIQRVQEGMPSTLSELEQAVNINSGTMNFEGVEQVGQLLRKQLSDLGFDAQWQDGKAFNRAGHVVANWQSNKAHAKKILLIGHLDTVFNKSDAFQQFKKLSKTTIAGPGITDMKGGNAIIIAMLRALKTTQVLENVDIRVVLTGDEESSGRPLALSKNAVIEGGKWADIALGFEDGDGNIKTAVTSRRGAVGWTLKVTGKPAHSSQIFREDIGYGAIYETARILNDFREQLSTQPYLTFNPGIISGGTSVENQSESSTAQAFGKANVIAQAAIVKGDIRALSVEQFQQAKHTMQTIVSKSLIGTKATLSFQEGYPPMAPSDGNKQLLVMYDQISKDLGFGQVVGTNPRNAGAADISFAANHVDMALDGLGLMGTGGHTKDEVADITSLQKNIEKAALLIYRLSRK